MNKFYIIISTAIFFISSLLTGQLAHEVEKTITVKELVNTRAAEFVDILKAHRLIYIEHLGGGEDVDERYRLYRWHYIKSWPSREDIPFLLSLVNSHERCGTLHDPYSSFHIRTSQTNKKVSSLAVILLSAIKRGEFNIHSDIDPPDDREEIIAWARSQAEAMEPGTP